MKSILIATKNPGKVREFQYLMSKYNVKVTSLLDIDYKDDIVEDAETFSENALIKARQIAKEYKTMVVADDSGLEIDALDGRPGVYSARYAGDARDDLANMNKVLTELEGVSEAERTARFVCAVAVVDEWGTSHVVTGTCEGLIVNEPIGTEGFGYDPIFYLPERKKTMAQIPKSEKNVLSHRAKAFGQLEGILNDFFTK